MKRAFQIGFLRSVGLRPDHFLLDVGCGTLRGGLPIIQYLEKAHYYGVELRPDVLREARKELKEANLESRAPVLRATDRLATIEWNAMFDYIWAFSVLIHMTDPVLHDCLELVGRSLNPNGVFYGNARIGQGTEGSWQGFPVVVRPLAFYQDAAARFHLRVAEVGTLESLGHRTGIATQDEQIMLMFTRNADSR